jgi:hypothetical protein
MEHLEQIERKVMKKTCKRKFLEILLERLGTKNIIWNKSFFLNLTFFFNFVKIFYEDSVSIKNFKYKNKEMLNKQNYSCCKNSNLENFL